MEKITSRRNPRCVHIKKLGANSDYRQSSGQFLCDGLKLLEEAVMCGAEIYEVLTAVNIPFPLPIDIRVYYTERSLIDSLSPLKSAQNTLFTCKIPKKAAIVTSSGTHILLDGVQDPGNVGTIIRTANAFGMKSVILTNGCADPYNPKTIRASMGAIFKQSIQYMSMDELVKLGNSGVRFIGATLGKDSKNISNIKYKDTIIVIGSEGRGISESITSICDEMITIPMAAECESLNAAVAAAIIMWEAKEI